MHVASLRRSFQHLVASASSGSSSSSRAGSLAIFAAASGVAVVAVDRRQKRRARSHEWNLWWSRIALPMMTPASETLCACQKVLPLELLSDGRFEDKYTLLEELGRGSFGVVYRANDQETGVRRAVKKLDMRGAGSLEQGFLISEVVTLRHLGRFPGLVSLVDCYEDASYIYIVMELCEGCDLLDWAGEIDQASKHEWAVLLKEMLLSIEFCNKKGVIHSDIKPENFILCSTDARQLLDRSAHGRRKDDTPLLKLADFGMARFTEMPPKFSEMLPQNVNLNGVGGTLTYMPPEMLKHSCVSASSDVWSLGVTVFALITGDYPFDTNEVTGAPSFKDIESFHETVRHKLKVNAIAAPLIDLLCQMLEYDPDKRISTEEALKHHFFSTLSRISRRSTVVQKEFDMHWQQKREISLRKTRAGRKMIETSIKPGGLVFRKGDTSNDIYFVRSGTLEVWNDNLYLTSLHPGDVVGELAALLGRPRSATVRCSLKPQEGETRAEVCNLLIIPADALPQLEKSAPMEVRRFHELADQRDMSDQALAWMQTVPLLKRCDIQFLKQLSQQVKPASLQKGDVLMTQGNIGTNMYILRSGELDVFVRSPDESKISASSPGAHVAVLKEGAIVGEMELLVTSSVRQGTVIAKCRSELLRLAKHDFQDLLSLYPKEQERLEKIIQQRLDARAKAIGS